MGFANLRAVGAKMHLQKLIPEGDYCYTYTGRVKIGNMVIGAGGVHQRVDYYCMPETKSCPFWNSVGEGSAHCTFLEHTSEYGHGSDEGFDLLWDQIKECGINTRPDEDYLADRPNYPDMPKVNKRSKRTPELLSSLVNLIMMSPDDHLTYDGTTYTLSQSVIDDRTPK